MKYSEVREGKIFYIEGCYSYPKRKVGKGHVDIRDGCANRHGNPDWDVELAENLPNIVSKQGGNGATPLYY